MKDRVYVALGFVMIASPAFAGLPVQVPEPASITVFAAAAAGAYAMRKFMRRK